jgi:hypothetical protein
MAEADEWSDAMAKELEGLSESEQKVKMQEIQVRAFESSPHSCLLRTLIDSKDSTRKCSLMSTPSMPTLLKRSKKLKR